MAVVITIATQQDNLEKSYNSYITKLDDKIATAIGAVAGIHALEK